MAFPIPDEDFYLCSVCLDDMTERNPRLLACHHSYCEECLVKLVRRGIIKCPTCRQITHVANNDVTELSKNFQLLGIKERENRLLSILYEYKEKIDTQQQSKKFVIPKYGWEDILHREFEKTVKEGYEVLRNPEKFNKVKDAEFLIAFPGIKRNITTTQNQTNQVRMTSDSPYVPFDYRQGENLFAPPEVVSEKKPLTLRCPWQVACLVNGLLAIADLKKDNVCVVNCDRNVMMSYKVREHFGEVTSVYSNDGKTLYIVQERCITSVCYPSTNNKTYYPDLSDMRGLYVLDDTNFIIYNNSTVCEYEPTTNKVKKVVRGLNNCNMCIPYKDTDTNKQRNIVIDDNEREDNIKIYNDRWNRIHSFGAPGSQDGMLDGPRRAVIVDDNLLVCDMYNHRVSCFTIKGDFICHVLTASDGITSPFGIDFSFPFLWITEVNYPKLATVKGYQYTE